MKEYLSDAIVLSREPSGESDLKISLFTQKFGKLVAKAKSARKITSKLSSHLEPSFIAKVRIIEKGGVQIVDAIKIGRVNAEPKDLAFLSSLMHEAEPDPALWHLLVSRELNWNDILRILGWNPASASCVTCEGRPKAFSFASQDFFCRDCVLNVRADEVIYI